MLLTVFDDQASRMKAKTSLICALLLSASGSAWAWAWTAFAERPALLGTALLAYLFGLRHAFDADHIAAIDNVVRKLTQEGKAPCSAGFFFSLGHSTIVFVASVAIATTAAAMQRQLDVVHDLGGTIGTTVSAFFLLAIGVANLLVLRSVWSAFAKARTGRKISDEDLNAPLAPRGLLAHIIRPLFRIVSRSWHMYPIGFLFGLGFDTATEISDQERVSPCHAVPRHLLVPPDSRTLFHGRARWYRAGLQENSTHVADFCVVSQTLRKLAEILAGS